jgi:hypothetical protein
MEIASTVDWGGKSEGKRDDNPLSIYCISCGRAALCEPPRKYLYGTADHIYDHIRVSFDTFQDIGLTDHK